LNGRSLQGTIRKRLKKSEKKGLMEGGDRSKRKLTQRETRKNGSSRLRTG